MCTFKLGEKVVCVNPVDELVINEIYTIKSVELDGYGETTIFLEEVYCGGLHDDFYGYCPSRFRKLDYDFAENLLAEIKEQVQSEYQLN